MTDYNKYVEAVNKIFELVAKMKAYYPDQDNLSLIEAIEENKQIVINSAKLFNGEQTKTPTAPVTESLEG